MTTEILNFMSISTTYPPLESPQVDRRHVLNAIEDLFEETNCDVVLIEGGEGIGKTTVAAQFVAANVQHAVNVFIRGASKFAYDPAMVQFELCNQINWYVTGEEFRDVRSVDDSVLRVQLGALQKQLKRAVKTMYIVVDGLAEVPAKDSHAAEAILDMLPFGVPRVRFILTGDSASVGLGERNGVKIKSLRLLPFTADEALRFFAGMNVKQAEVERVAEFCRSNPGKMAIFRRLIQRGSDVDTLLMNGGTKVTDLFGLEWQPVSALSEAATMALAIITFDQNGRSMDELSSICSLANNDTKMLLDLTFIVTTQDNRLGFVSEGFRSFASGRLSHLKQSAADRVIEWLMRNPDDDIAISSLPSQLEQAGRMEELLNYLTPARFERMVLRTETVAGVRKQLSLGVEAAVKVGRPAALLGYAVQGAATTEINYAVSSQQEVEALVGVGNVKAALGVAQATLLREDRLQLLAIIARSFVERGDSDEYGILDQIRALAAQIEPRTIGRRAVEIAADLVVIDQELAITFAEAATADGSAESLDWVAATLALSEAKKWISSGKEKVSHGVPSGSVIDKLFERFTRQIRVVYAGVNGEELIKRLEDLDNPRDRFFVAKYWLARNADALYAGEVARYALTLMLSLVDNTITAADLVMVFAPLRHLPRDSELHTWLLQRLDAVLPTIQGVSSTLDVFDLRVERLRASVDPSDSVAFAAALDRLVVEVTQISDASIRSAAFAYLLAEFSTVDRSSAELECTKVKMQEHLAGTIKEILCDVADQFTALERTLYSMAQYDVDRAMTLCEELNTPSHRDDARIAVISALVDGDAVCDLAKVDVILRRFEASGERDASVAQVLERLYTEPKHLSVSPEAVKRILSLACNIDNLSDRCDAIAVAAASVLRHSATGSFDIDVLLGQLLAAWSAMPLDWRRVETGFQIASVLAGSASAEAATYVDLAEGLRQQTVDIDGPQMAVHVAMARLAVRAFGGLVSAGVDVSSDYDDIADVIESFAATLSRLDLWNDLAVRYLAADRHDAAREIVGKKIISVMVASADVSADEWTQMMRSTAPALYATHRSVAFEFISKISDTEERDVVYSEILDFLFTKTSSWEPARIDSLRGSSSITWQDALDIVDVVGRVSEDGQIFYYIDDLVNSIVSGRGFSQSQAADIAKRIEEIGNRFPSARGVQHTGYREIMRVEALKLLRGKVQDWLDILDAVQAIPNCSDRAFVMSYAAAGMPTKHAFESHRKRAIEMTLQAISSIPCDGDKIGRYCVFAELLSQADEARARSVLKDAAALLANNDEVDAATHQSVIDLAVSFGDSFASAVAKLVDNDSARPEVRERMKRRLRIQQTKRTLIDASYKATTSGTHKPAEDAERSRAAWMTLGELNGGRYEFLEPSTLRRMLMDASAMRLRDAFPMFMLYLESEARRLKRSANAKRELRPVFEAMTGAARFVSAVVRKKSSYTRDVRWKATVVPDGSAMLVRLGERSMALAYIREWVERADGEYLKICDPYFSPEQLGIVRDFLLVRPQLRVTVLSSRSHDARYASAEAAFRSAWSEIGVASESNVEVVLIGDVATGRLPIHDRWLLSAGGGLQLGTSLHSLGEWRSSEIAQMQPGASRAAEDEFDRFVSRRTQEVNGKRLEYTRFAL